MAKSRVLHRLKERFGELIQEARLLSALVPLWCDRPRIPSSGPGLALVARMELTYVPMLSSTDENLELCGPASRLSFLLRASVRQTDACHSQGAQATDTGPSQTGSCQTVKGDGSKPGVRFLARSK